jgi:hypothetical protein
MNNVLGDNGMNLKNIIKWMSEEGFSGKEEEKNEGEIRKSTINDSGTVTYVKLRYKENIHGCYRQAYGLLILWGCALDDCIYCTFYIHSVQDYK